jgi:FixJ family two-component response regulator
MGRSGEGIAVRRTVIVVDDDPAVRNSLKFSLELEGFSVEAFASGRELLESGNLPAGSCLVVDQRLPGMSGLDLIARLRARSIAMPAILITTHPSTALAERAVRANIPIVEKPLLGNALIDRIREICRAIPNNGHARQ